MRCVSCNCILTDQEATRKSVVTAEYMDMCNACLGTIWDDIVGSLPEEDELFDIIDEEEDGEEDE